MLFENVELGATPGGAESGDGVFKPDGLEAQDIGRTLDDIIVERITATACPVDAENGLTFGKYRRVARVDVFSYLVGLIIAEIAGCEGNDAPETVADRDNKAVAEQGIYPTALFIPFVNAGLQEQIFGDSFAPAEVRQQFAVLRSQTDATSGAEILRPTRVGILTGGAGFVVHLYTELIEEEFMHRGDGGQD